MRPAIDQPLITSNTYDLKVGDVLTWDIYGKNKLDFMVVTSTGVTDHPPGAILYIDGAGTVGVDARFSYFLSEESDTQQVRMCQHSTGAVVPFFGKRFVVNPERQTVEFDRANLSVDWLYRISEVILARRRRLMVPP